MNDKIKLEIPTVRTVPLLPERSEVQPSAPGSIEREDDIKIVRTVPLLPDRSKVEPSAPGSIEREDDTKNGRHLAHPAQEHAPLMDKPQSDLIPSNFAVSATVQK